MIHVKKHLELLGFTVKDVVTGFHGVVASVSFDLYGCVQALVNPGMGKDGKLGEQQWFDVARLVKLSGSPVMPPPDFEHGPVAEGRRGPAEKPACNKS